MLLLSSSVSLKIGPLDIPQVDYEPYLRPGFYNLPDLDLKSVNFSRIVNKTHVSAFENEQLRVMYCQNGTSVPIIQSVLGTTFCGETMLPLLVAQTTNLAGGYGLVELNILFPEKNMVTLGQYLGSGK